MREQCLYSVSLLSKMLNSKTYVNFFRARTTQADWTQEERKRAGIQDNLIQISVGLEDTNDLLQDLEQALKGARN